MEFKPTPLFNDCIKEHIINKNILVPTTAVNLLNDYISRNDYTDILAGLKEIHNNKDFYYVDPNNIHISRICSVLFFLIHFDPQPQQNMEFIDDVKIIYNNIYINSIKFKNSYDIYYDDLKIVAFIKTKAKEIEMLKSIFLYVLLQDPEKRIKIAWL